MKGLGILILIVLFLWLVWPVISRWLKRKAMERTEDYIRASMGMPPRDRSKRKDSYAGNGYNNGRHRNPYEKPSGKKEPIIPKEYAEDVEFTETIDYSERVTVKNVDGTTVYKESQISDAEYTEIKKDRTK